MMHLSELARRMTQGVPRRLVLTILTLLGALVPTFAFASGGENVVLHFTDSDKMYLFISLGLGLVALIFAYLIGADVMRKSPGTEKMQEVGAAIKSGAMAYLAQQVKMMIPFVIVLAAGLGFFFGSQFGTNVGAFISVAFVLGVSASYIAGYTGMLLAVNGNMRSAAAALNGPKGALEVAFRSGAVAGLVTVGMGLIGATAIFLVTGENAMKVLVGFGFGGSLAALFMRVGGGIFTKAADVGADLVGKVEAGIPEDDPRNPATIADNVGDNVGDCAGMAADVFESYEVTLVAAIVLGAATAAIFDQATWMKLVLFALMARGVGIVASIFGILSVRGSDNVDDDPLKKIRAGFWSSAALAVAGTGVLAYFMMGGTGSPIRTTQLVATQQYQRDETDAIQRIREKIASQLRMPLYAVGVSELLPETLPEFKGKKLVSELDKSFSAKRFRTNKELTPLNAAEIAILRKYQEEVRNMFRSLDAKSDEVLGDNDLNPANSAIGRAISMDPERTKFTQGLDGLKASEGNSLSGYQKIDWTNNAANPNPNVWNYAVTVMPKQPTEQPRTASLKEVYYDEAKGKPVEIGVFEIEVERAEDPSNPAAGPSKQKIWIGPVVKSDLAEQIKQIKPEQKVKIKWNSGDPTDPTNDPQFKSLPVSLYSNAEGRVALGIEGGSEVKDLKPQRLGGIAPFSYYNITKETYKTLEEERNRQPDKDELKLPAPMPVPENMPVAIAEQKVVPWYLFFFAILFGVAMAFAIELLTDYYVSTHKKPVQEVAGVSSAGAAPMIIQGFALAKESSVFSVFSIVVALIFPLFLFPPAEYGGYILSFYGIALVGLGLLTTTGYILAMDTFGPISDNAQGVFEMSGAGHDSPEGAKAVQRLDAAGNTTKALTKGFAIATAVVAAVALFHSYVEGAKLTDRGLPLDIPEIFMGLLIGGAAPFLFSAFSINAVGRASFQLINEVRRQFAADPGIMKGTSKPDYGRCVAIVTAAAQRELLGPGILAVALPLAVAFGFSIGKEPVIIGGQAYNLVGAQALGGFLAGAILSGQLMAVLLANAGGIWDNAKKVIEDGMYGGKGSEAHKAAVVCDTVGDPFKDTAGPALNPLIKVMNLVALLLIPAIISPYSNTILATITGVCILLLVIAIVVSKKGSISSELNAVAAEKSVTGSSAEAIGSGETPSKKTLKVEDDEPAS